MHLRLKGSTTRRLPRADPASLSLPCPTASGAASGQQHLGVQGPAPGKAHFVSVRKMQLPFSCFSEPHGGLTTVPAGCWEGNADPIVGQRAGVAAACRPKGPEGRSPFLSCNHSRLTRGRQAGHPAQGALSLLGVTAPVHLLKPLRMPCRLAPTPERGAGSGDPRAFGGPGDATLFCSRRNSYGNPDIDLQLVCPCFSLSDQAGSGSH